MRKVINPRTLGPTTHPISVTGGTILFQVPKASPIPSKVLLLLGTSILIRVVLAKKTAIPMTLTLASTLTAARTVKDKDSSNHHATMTFVRLEIKYHPRLLQKNLLDSSRLKTVPVPAKTPAPRTSHPTARATSPILHRHLKLEIVMKGPLLVTNLIAIVIQVAVVAMTNHLLHPLRNSIRLLVLRTRTTHSHSNDNNNNQLGLLGKH